MLLLSCWAAASDIRLDIRVSEPLRDQIPLRCLVIGHQLPREAGVLSLALLADGRELARSNLTLADSRSMQAGVRAVLPIVTLGATTLSEVRLVVTWKGAASPLVTGETPVTSLAQLRQRYARLDAAFGPRPAALPALWLEQAAELTLGSGGQQDCADLDRLCAHLEAWQRGVQPHATEAGTTMLAFRDPVDDSVQPLRVHRVAHAGSDRAVLLLMPQPGVRKSAWPVPTTQIAPWLAQGLTVVEAYPAGDVAWNGLAPRRALLAWAAAGLDPDCQRVVVGIGTAASAALLLAEQEPQRSAAVVLVDATLGLPPDGEAERTIWTLRSGGQRHELLRGVPVFLRGPDPSTRAWAERTQALGVVVDAGTEEVYPLAATARSTANATAPRRDDRGPFAGLHGGPVAIIIGSGEHVAAQQANRTLADSLIQAWNAHSQGVPTVRLDSDKIDDLHQHHLICIGTPRSNRVLAKLVDKGLDPLASWTERELSLDGRTWLRSEGRPLMIRRKEPGRDRMIIILDGRFTWPKQGLPLGDLSDCYLGGPDGVSRNLDSDWR